MWLPVSSGHAEKMAIEQQQSAVFKEKDDILAANLKVIGFLFFFS
jgi:hypothetical protein